MFGKMNIIAETLYTLLLCQSILISAAPESNQVSGITSNWLPSNISNSTK